MQPRSARCRRGARPSSGAAETAVTAIADAYAKTDPDVTVTVSGAPEEADTWTDGGTRAVLDLITVVPSGPLAMSPDFDGLVETSTSVGRAVTDGATFTLHSLSRSSNASALPDVMATLDASARHAGGTLVIGQRMPGLDVISFGPQIEAAHSPDERVSIPTVERFWRLLAGVVDELSAA